MASTTYRDAGVDIEAGERLVDRIKPFAASTKIPESLGSLGGFAALCRLPTGMKKPLLVSGTDGVGTKLKLAFEADRHDTVGIDLVAMCVNDVITVGARPLFFLDYLGTGALDVDRAAKVVEGIAEGCRQAGCALLGGETAELPGMYAPGEYDLAGFAVGVVEEDDLITGDRVREGDAILGVASNGMHSNGFSLARKVLLDDGGLALDGHVEALGEPLIDCLLRPTPLYWRTTETALKTGSVRALCHVTGGGLPGNLPRVLPEGLGARLDRAHWSCPAIFELIASLGNVAEAEMARTFNMGIGLVAVVPSAEAETVLAAWDAAGVTASKIGDVISAAGAVGEARVNYGR